MRGGFCDAPIEMRKVDLADLLSEKHISDTRHNA
jgi:hypothetical protein